MSWRDINPDPIRPMNDTVADDEDINEPWEPALTGTPRRDLGDAAQPEVITCYLCNGDGARHIGDGLEFETFECTACEGSGLTEPRVS